MTPISKAVTRVSISSYHNSRRRALVCTLGPGDVIYLRPKGCRQAEGIDLISVYEMAVKRRVCKERFDKAQARRKGKQS